MSIRDHWPAFPCRFENTGDRNAQAPGGVVVAPGQAATFPGMELRDYFAEGEMRAIAGNSTLFDYLAKAETSPDDFPAGTARAAYAIADAMLAERMK
jgi:hypothetical protein